MSELTVDTEQMTRAATEYGNGVETATASRARVEAMRTTLMTAWEGNAALAYSAVVQEWLNGYRRVIDALSNLTDSLRTSTATLGSAEDEALSQVSGLQTS